MVVFWTSPLLWVLSCHLSLFSLLRENHDPCQNVGLDALSWIKCFAQTTFKQKVMFLYKISNHDHIHLYQIQSFLWNVKCWHNFPKFSNHHICGCFVAFTVTVVVFRHFGNHQIYRCFLEITSLLVVIRLSWSPRHHRSATTALFSTIPLMLSVSSSLPQIGAFCGNHLICGCFMVTTANVAVFR